MSEYSIAPSRLNHIFTDSQSSKDDFPAKDYRSDEGFSARHRRRSSPDSSIRSESFKSTLSSSPYPSLMTPNYTTSLDTNRRSYYEPSEPSPTEASLGSGSSYHSGSYSGSIASSIQEVDCKSPSSSDSRSRIYSPINYLDSPQSPLTPLSPLSPDLQPPSPPPGSSATPSPVSEYFASRGPSAIPVGRDRAPPTPLTPDSYHNFQDRPHEADRIRIPIPSSMSSTQPSWQSMSSFHTCTCTCQSSIPWQTASTQWPQFPVSHPALYQEHHRPLPQPPTSVMTARPPPLHIDPNYQRLAGQRYQDYQGGSAGSQIPRMDGDEEQYGDDAPPPYSLVAE